MSAYVLSPSYQILQDIGVTLQQIEGYEEQGYLLASEGIYNLQLHRYTNFQSLTAIEDKDIGVQVKDDTNNNNVFRIAFYCFEYGYDWWPHWGPKASQRKGGSEEAVIYLSRAIVAAVTAPNTSQNSILSSFISSSQQQPIKFEVEMYTDSFKEDLGRDDEGVMWYHYSQFNPEQNPPDMFISWRYPLSMVIGKNSNKSKLSFYYTVLFIYLFILFCFSIYLHVCMYVCICMIIHCI